MSKSANGFANLRKSSEPGSASILVLPIAQNDAIPHRGHMLKPKSKRTKKAMLAVVQRMKDWREANNLSQRQAFDAMAAGGLPISIHTLQHYEAGTRAPGAGNAYAITKFLDENPIITDAPTYRRNDPLPKSKIAEIKALREQGLEYKAIGERLGISESGAWRLATGSRSKRVRTTGLKKTAKTA